MFCMIAFFDKSQQLVEDHGQYTQNDNAEHDVIQPEYLTAVNDQVTQTDIGCQKFTDNDADEAETDIDFQIADDGRDTGREDNISQDVSACASKCPDEQQFITVNVDKGGVKVDDGAEDGHCHTAYNDGFHIVAEPDNEDWG